MTTNDQSPCVIHTRNTQSSLGAYLVGFDWRTGAPIPVYSPRRDDAQVYPADYAARIIEGRGWSQSHYCIEA
jgi:hypothetical protein